ncbi:MAG TPA: hypothetical protein VMG09_17080 [Bacteroidota bacterium]|nr:hypothetical protein [Bacteroidota bacterium]
MQPKPSVLMPALYGGIVIAVISAVPGLNLLNCLCCAGVMIGGAMAVFFYKKDLTEGHPPLTSGDAVQLGALAGVFGALIGSAISAAILAAFGDVSKQLLLSFMDQYRSRIPPEAFDQMERSMAMGGGLWIISLVSSLVIDTIFGLLGGLIGYAIWKPKPGATPPPSYTPPQKPAV